MRLYIALPINSREEKTKKARFRAAERRSEQLRAMLAQRAEFELSDIVTPFDVNPLSEPVSEETALGRCVAAVLRCDAIYLDKGWKGSKGCNLEYHAAITYGKRIIVQSAM